MRAVWTSHRELGLSTSFGLLMRQKQEASLSCVLALGIHRLPRYETQSKIANRKTFSFSGVAPWQRKWGGPSRCCGDDLPDVGAEAAYWSTRPGIGRDWPSECSVEREGPANQAQA